MNGLSRAERCGARRGRRRSALESSAGPVRRSDVWSADRRAGSPTTPGAGSATRRRESPVPTVGRHRRRATARHRAPALSGTPSATTSIGRRMGRAPSAWAGSSGSWASRCTCDTGASADEARDFATSAEGQAFMRRSARSGARRTRRQVRRPRPRTSRGAHERRLRADPGPSGVAGARRRRDAAIASPRSSGGAEGRDVAKGAGRGSSGCSGVRPRLAVRAGRARGHRRPVR